MDRGRAQEAATGFKPGKTSTGIPTAMSLVQRREWDEIEPMAQHVGDFVAYITDIRKTVNRNCIASLVVPREYQHELIDGADAATMGLMMVRMYVVPRRPFMEGGMEEWREQQAQKAADETWAQDSTEDDGGVHT